MRGVANKDVGNVAKTRYSLVANDPVGNGRTMIDLRTASQQMQLPTFQPAVDSYYLDRPAIQETIRRSVRVGRNVVVSGPRRSGKTSLLYHIRIEAEASPERWLQGKTRSVLFLDGQALDHEARLVQRLSSLLPDEQNSPKELLALSSRSDEKLLLSLFRELLNTFDRIGHEVLLLIDEVDLPLHHRSTGAWRQILGELFRHPATRLIVTADALNLDDLLDGFPSNRITHVEMTRWSAGEIRALIERTPLYEVIGEAKAARLSQILAPAWPIEVMLVLRQISEDGTFDEPNLGRLLDEHQVTDYGIGLVDRTLRRLDRSDTRKAITLLTSIAEAEAVDGAKGGAKRAIDPDNLGKILSVARELTRAGVLATNGRLIAAATPVMLHALRSFLGL